MSDSVIRTEPGVASAIEREARYGQRARLALLAVLVLAVCLAPMVVYPVFLMKVMCFAIFAMAFNLLLGHVGLLAFGHAAFFGMASYVSAYGTKELGLSPELALIAGTGTAAAMGLLFGLIAIRRQGIYFAMITLALAQMVYFLCVQVPSFTGGEDGIHAVPRRILLGVFDLANTTTIYAMASVVFLGAFLLVQRIIESPFGQILRAIRDNENRAISLGYRVNTYKLIAFILSAGLAGLAGALKALIFQVATLTDVHWTMSGEPVIMTLVGGLGTMSGPIIGAAVFTAMQSYLAHLGSWVMFIQGAVFFICVLFFRKGLLGIMPERLRKWL